MRVLGLPNIALILFMGLNLAWLALQYQDHDEHWFSFNLEIATAGGLIYIAYFLLSFSTNALVQVCAFPRGLSLTCLILPHVALFPVVLLTSDYI